VRVAGKTTRVLVEQTVAISPDRLGDYVCHLSFNELRDVDEALAIVLGID